MTRTTNNAQGDTAAFWFGVQVDRQIIVYEDAISLKRGFQFWLSWSHVARNACRCVPIYLPHADRPELGELLQPPCDRSLFVLSRGSTETFSRANARRLRALTKRDCAREKRFILLFPTAQARTEWFRQRPLFGIQEFAHGCYSAVPTPWADGNIEAPLHYTLRPAPPRRSTSAVIIPAAIGTRASEGDILP